MQKETQDRTRKRIKEDLKGSASAHADFAENTLPKLKRAYIKKCQDFEVTIILLCLLCCIGALIRHWCLGTANRTITRQLSLPRMWAKRPLFLFLRVVPTQVLVPIPISLLQGRPWCLLSRFGPSIANPPVAVLETAHRRALRLSLI
jgi:hypothetical protein